VSLKMNHLRRLVEYNHMFTVSLYLVVVFQYVASILERCEGSMCDSFKAEPSNLGHGIRGSFRIRSSQYQNGEPESHEHRAHVEQIAK
jgi:hypothetical protein